MIAWPPKPIMAFTHGPNNFQAFLSITMIDQVGCHLVFDAGPDLVRIDKRQRGTISIRLQLRVPT